MAKRKPKIPPLAESSGSRVAAGATAATMEPIDSIVPWPDNANEGDVAGVMRSMKRWGFGAPLVCRLANREVIKGHTRLEAAKRLRAAGERSKTGETFDLVSVRFRDLSEDEAHKLARADNRLGRKAKTDRRKLTEQLLDDYDIGGIDDLLDQGWDQAWVDKQTAPDEGIREIDLDDVEDEFWIAVRGPMPKQADALDALRKALEGLGGLEVEIGTTAL